MGLDDLKIFDIGLDSYPVEVEIEAGRYLHENPNGTFIARAPDSINAAIIFNFLSPRNLQFDFERIELKDNFREVPHGVKCYRRAAA